MDLRKLGRVWYQVRDGAIAHDLYTYDEDTARLWASMGLDVVEYGPVAWLEK